MSHSTSGGHAVRRTALALALLLSAAVPTSIRGAAAPAPLPRSTPEAQGVSSARLLAFVDAVDANIDAMHSFMLLRHGQVVAEGWWTPYDAQTRHALYSLTKSFTSTAVGLAIAEGRLSLDDRVLEHFPDAAPAAPSDELKALRVRDLLTMSTGHHTEPALAGAEPWTKAFLAAPVAHKPGTFFLYNTPASYMLSAIVQKTTGSTLRAYLTPRLFDVIGIVDPEWDTSPEGVSIGGYGMKLRTEEIARFGQLYLRKGNWEGQQVLPAAWVELATSRQMSNGSNPESDWDQGYGFQFWRTRHGFYRGDGAFGQFCLVSPDLDAVVVITSGVRSMPAVLTQVWDKLLPAFEKGPLPADETNRQKLTARLASLQLPTPTGAQTSAIGARMLGRQFAFAANDQKIESLGLESHDGGRSIMLAARINGVVYKTPASYGGWAKGRFAFGSQQGQAAAVSGAWTAEDTYKAVVRFNETPFAVTLTMRFADSQLVVDSEMNPSRGPAKQPTLTSASRTN